MQSQLMDAPDFGIGCAWAQGIWRYHSLGVCMRPVRRTCRWGLRIDDWVQVKVRAQGKKPRAVDAALRTSHGPETYGPSTLMTRISGYHDEVAVPSI